MLIKYTVFAPQIKPYCIYTIARKSFVAKQNSGAIPTKCNCLTTVIPSVAPRVISDMKWLHHKEAIQKVEWN
jgi:hypothetical protein